MRGRSGTNFRDGLTRMLRMDNRGLNELILKCNVIAYWLQDPCNRPVNLTSVLRPPPFWAAGYVTCWKFLAGRTLQEAEQMLGLRAHELQGGAYWYEFQRTPQQDEFDARGYAQCPDGKAWKANSGFPSELGAPQWRIHADVHIPLRLLGFVAPGGRFV